MAFSKFCVGSTKYSYRKAHGRHNDLSLGPLGGGEGDGCGAFAEGEDAVANAVHLPFGKDDQWMRAVLEDLDRLLKRLEVRPVAVDAEAAVPAHHELPRGVVQPNRLPRGHIVERTAGPIGCRGQEVRIGEAIVIRREENAVAGGERCLQMHDTVDLDFIYSFLTPQQPAADRRHRPHDPRPEARRPPAGSTLGW